MSRRALALAVPFIAGSAIAWSFGGWAVITLDDLPEQVAVGKPTTLSFSVRQHGVSPMNNVKPTIEARSGSMLSSETVHASAVPGKTAGQYTATLVFPKPGDWRVTINSGWGNSNVTLLPIPAVEAGKTVAAMSDVDRGKRLFLAKGCATCHVNKNVEGGMQMDVGPNLTEKTFDPAYLTAWLANPRIRPATKPGQEMPNLGLSQKEVASLTAFINEGAKTASAKKEE